MSSHPASPVTLTPLQLAYANFCRDIHANRPHDLRLSNSSGALTGRFIDIEAQILIFATWLEALIEDTAGHTHLSRREADHVKAVLQDLASDIRGRMRESVENVAA